MKTIITFLAAILIVINGFGQVELIGHVVDENNNKLKNIQINVYDGNDLVINESVSKKFDFNLKTNKYYTIEILKNGFYTKRIIVETNIINNNSVEPFEFKIELVKTDVEIGETAYDFPVAIVRYRQHKGGFHYNIIKNNEF